MDTADIRDLFEYAHWANSLLLAKAQSLSAEQLVQPSDFPHGSFRDTFAHMLFANWIWRKRLEGNSPKAGERMPEPEDYPDLPSLSKALDDDWEKTQTYLAALDDARLAGEFTYSTTQGVTHRQAVAKVLLHAIIHSVQHRSELAQILTEFGHSPGDIDYMMFVRAK